ncbi:MAG: hypothetical protein R2788_12175 [Saprospiraceae bacterium]
MTYVWDDQQTEAYLNIVGDSKELVYNGQPFTYLVPNRNQCKAATATTAR